MMLRGVARREQERIQKVLKEVWDADFPDEKFSWWVSQKGKVFLTSKEAGKCIEHYQARLRIENAGVYFGFFEKKRARLSVEGAQLLAQYAKKKMVELDEEEVWQWVRGFDLEKEVPEHRLVLLRYKGEVVGVGNAKDGKILNTIPKERRIKNIAKHG